MSHNVNSYKLSAVLNTYYIGLSQIVTSGINYIAIAVLTGLGPEVYGTWVLVIFFAGYITPWISLGLENSLVKFLPGLFRETEIYQVWLAVRKTCFLASIIAGCISLLLGDLLSQHLFGNSENNHLVVFAVLIFFVEAQLSLGSGVLLAREEVKIVSRLNVLRSLSELIGLIVVAAFTTKVEMLLGIRVLIGCSLVIIQQITIRSNLNINFAFSASLKTPIGKYVRFGLPIVPANFIWLLLAGIDRFMLNKYCDVVDVAYYSLADSIAISVNNFSRPITGVIKPRIANIVQKMPEEEGIYIIKTLKFQCIFLIPICVFISALAPEIIDTFFGSEFVSASEFISALCIAHLLIALASPLNSHVMFRRGGEAYLYFLPICLVINVGLNFLLIPVFAGAGAALSTLFSHVAYAVALYLLADKNVILQLIATKGTFYKVLLAASCMIVTALFILANFPGVGRPVGWFVGGIIYAIFILKLNVITQAEAEAILQPIANVKRKWKKDI